MTGIEEEQVAGTHRAREKDEKAYGFCSIYRIWKFLIWKYEFLLIAVICINGLSSICIPLLLGKYFKYVYTSVPLDM